MRAVQIPRLGGVEVLELVELDDPSPGPGEVLIDVAFSGVNFIDTYQRSGLYEMELPFIAGSESSGVVVALGEGVDRFAVGDRVSIMQGSGGYATTRVAPAEHVVSVPDGVALDQACAAMIQGLTAHYLTTDTYPLASGDKCLIHAAAGGTGRLAVQLAKRAGAEVFATVGTQEKAELALAAGADHAILYREVNFADEVRRIAGENRPLDVVYDGVGAAVFEQSLSLLRPRGLMCTFGNASGAVEPMSPLTLSQNGSLFLTRPTLFHYVATVEELDAKAAAVFGAIESGELEITIDTIYPLEEAASAHVHLEERRTMGKLLLSAR